VRSMRGLVVWPTRVTARARYDRTGIWTKSQLGQWKELRVRARRGPHSLSLWGTQRKAYQLSHLCVPLSSTKSCRPPPCPQCVPPLLATCSLVRSRSVPLVQPSGPVASGCRALCPSVHLGTVPFVGACQARDTEPLAAKGVRRKALPHLASSAGWFTHNQRCNILVHNSMSGLIIQLI